MALDSFHSCAVSSASFYIFTNRRDVHNLVLRTFAFKNGALRKALLTARALLIKPQGSSEAPEEEMFLFF